jgi:hypothetical protein
MFGSSWRSSWFVCSGHLRARSLDTLATSLNKTLDLYQSLRLIDQPTPQNFDRAEQ